MKTWEWIEVFVVACVSCLILLWTNSPWIRGLVISLGFGQFATDIFVSSLRCYLGLERKVPPEWDDDYRRDYPTWVIGTLERLFFTILIAYYGPAVVTAMVAWVIGKMATHWNYFARGRSRFRMYGVTGLHGNLFSMLFALLGGMICKGDICINFIPKVWGN